ncbi:NifU family protein [Sanyastnella coralliicola]|uniref:NifU family protein n=1 Tax=Sanyastnella coralliicola TaxID=3069118 RepID=UPI0027BA1745|nr:NifU family protein [Longitalea sp. SCSIO 12813]
METKKIPTAVYAEMTPNPSVMKFVADRMLINGGEQVQYTSKESVGDSSPLADELFNFPFVTQVFVSANFVSVTKDDSLGWEMIVQQLREYIREWLTENEVAVAFVPESAVVTPENFTPPTAPSANQPQLSAEDIIPSEFDAQIKQLLDDFVRPAVEQDGGAIDFMAYKEGTVYVTMRGACSGCPSSMQTLKGGIENLLKTHIEQVEEVVAYEG